MRDIPTRTPLGDVVVADADSENPYTSDRIEGPARADALRTFRDRGNCSGVTFWHAPTNGGARLLETPDEVDWTGLRD